MTIFEPWWEEKDLGAPPPEDIAWERANERNRRAFDDWVARGAPESETTPTLLDGWIRTPGGQRVTLDDLEALRQIARHAS